MIDQAKICVHVLAYRCHPNTWLVQWLTRHGLDWRRSDQSIRHMDVAMNRAVTNFLAGEHYDYFLSINADAVPTESTERLLTEEGDLLYCGHVGSEGSRGHVGDENFGLGCFRASRKLLESMPMPWFEREVNADTPLRGKCWADRGEWSPPLTEVPGCECNSFRVKAAGLGKKSRMVGIVGDEQTPGGPVLYPAPGTKSGWRLAWPGDLDTPRKRSAAH